MSAPVISQQNTRAGLCPHGLVPSACPICNSGGGMGATNKLKDAPIQKTSNEWSWIKCYAVGLSMRAQEARIENSKNAFERQIEYSRKLAENIQNISDKIKNVIQNIQDSSNQFFKPIVQFVSNILINPLLSLIFQIPKLIEKMAILEKNIANMLLQAGEKLTALLGDLKNFIDKKIFETLKEKAKKIFWFFTSNIEDENYKNDEVLAIFKSRELKKFIYKLIKRRKKDAN